MITEILARLDKTEQDVRELKDKLRNVTGNPIIKSYQGVIFDLNESFNANSVLRRIEALERGGI